MAVENNSSEDILDTIVQNNPIPKDTVFLNQVQEAWRSKEPLPASFPNEIKEVQQAFRFTEDTITEYLVVSRMDRYAKGFIVDGATGIKLVGDTLRQEGPENMFWTRPSNDGLKFNPIRSDKNQYDLEVYHTWKLENSTTQEYYLYHYDEASKSAILTEKKTLVEEEWNRFSK